MFKHVITTKRLGGWDNHALGGRPSPRIAEPGTRAVIDPDQHSVALMNDKEGELAVWALLLAWVDGEPLWLPAVEGDHYSEVQVQS